MASQSPTPGNPANPWGSSSTPAGPDDSSQAQRNKFLDWLNQRWPDEKRECPICSATDWRITEVVGLREFRAGMFDAAVVIPVIGVTCQTCGFVHWFNAMLSGVVPRQDDSSAWNKT